MADYTLLACEWRITLYWHVSGRLHSLATKVAQIKITDFSGETFKYFEVLYFSMSATTTQLLSSG
jgi:hypothetical protein